MFGELGPEGVDIILKHQLIGQIGCHANDITYVVPVSYAYHEDCIYSLSQEGMKIDMMRLNPKVCFEVHTMENMANWQSVVIWGDYEELTAEAERENAIRILLKRDLPAISSSTTHITPDWPAAPDNKLSEKVKGIVFRIKITKKTGRYENREIIPY